MNKVKIANVLEKVDELESLLTERIADMYKVKGFMQARHAYIFYRKVLNEIKDLIVECHNNKKGEK